MKLRFNNFALCGVLTLGLFTGFAQLTKAAEVAGGAHPPAGVVAISIDAKASPRLQYGADQLEAALKERRFTVLRGGEGQAPGPGTKAISFTQAKPVSIAGVQVKTEEREAYSIANDGPDKIVISGSGPSGELYGCLALAENLKSNGWPNKAINIAEAPAFSLRGACIGMQLPSTLPGRKIYEFPYTPENFPWFYDKAQWIEYLDMLAQNRMNTLYLWNGHPFASLVKLDDYPYALEVTEEEYQKNVEMFGFITKEADKRGIWVIQMFYNIFVSKPFAEKNNIQTQLGAPTPLVSDYTRKSIAKFVEQYPNVGLMLCLGEALRGKENQEDWLCNTIIPGMKDGMKALGTKVEPPIVVRNHTVGDMNSLMAAAHKTYQNIYTEAKYNGESLTTYEPRGKWQQIHKDMAKVSMHIANIHILSNLEPFRYGATEFIRKSVLACRDRFDAQGVHLYPLAYWDWPSSPDKTTPLLKQYDRDWIWFEAWARYTWNPDREAKADRQHWIDELTARYGTPAAAKLILAAYNDSGECAPMMLRRFGITEGNRQTYSLGMTLDQLVHPERYGVISELWESQSPPGERLDVYMQREWDKQPHEGETPVSVLEDCLNFSAKAVEEIDKAGPSVKTNGEEYERLRNDMYCIRAVTENYAAKVRAAMCVLRYDKSHDIADMKQAEKHLEESLEAYKRLVGLTKDTYRYANSLQIGHRRIPLRGELDGQPAFYHWTQMLPEYEKELADFKETVTLTEQESKGLVVPRPAEALPNASFNLLSDAAMTFTLREGAQPFLDQEGKITKLAPELQGLTGLRLKRSVLEMQTPPPIKFVASAPVKLLVGYFESGDAAFAKPPNPDVDSRSSEHGGVEATLMHAATIQGLPPMNVHVFNYDGQAAFDPRGPGRYLILGFVPAGTEIKTRDVGLPGGE